MNKKRILIVDDEANTTRPLKALLEINGEYIVREENNDEKAVETAQEFKPDLILLDVLMPHLDGARIAARIRSVPDFVHTPIIFVTGIVEKQETYKQENLGNFPLLVKPASIEEVREAIKTHLQVDQTI